jgi:ribonucleoside-diphosphate reductase alpha chain
MGTIPDSLEGIFEMLKEAAITMQQGGGIGFDFSTIRPKGAAVAGVGADASGPLSFMDVWDAMCRTIMSAGSRRGAMMATMRCDHPDIEDFIAAKHDSTRLRMFNLSVLATDAFMQAIDDDAPWDLQFRGRVYRTVPARDLWNRIMRATYDYAEPGVIFIDRINRANNLHYAETIDATNPCGEQPLPPYGACLLGSINLAALVRDPFEAAAALDQAELTDLVATAIRMMDNVVDTSRFPLEAQRAEAQAKRRIGLGVTGLADALLMTGLRYGSDDAVAQTGRWMQAVQHAAYRASVELAREKGAFPLFDRGEYLKGEVIRALPADIRDGIAEHGIRNALVTSIAPTGTISLFAGNVSSGIEPIFAYAYTRKVLMPDGSHTEEEVVDYAVAKFREKFGPDAPLPDYFANAQTCLHASLPDRLQGLHHLPSECGYRLGPDRNGPVREGRIPACHRSPPAPRRGGLYLRASGAARDADGPDLQAEMARQPARHLHHHERHCCRRSPAALRDIHQLEEHGTLRLDRGPDPDDLGGVPARRRCLLRGRGTQSGL